MTSTVLSLKKSLREIRRGGELEVHERVDLRAWTALRVGGVADLVIRCHSADALQAAIDVMAAHGLRWLVLGSGSRLVPSDRGLRSPALSLSGGLARWRIEEQDVVAGAGANLTQLKRSMAHAGLGALAVALGSRTTLGGALCAAARHDESLLRGAVQWLEIARPGTVLERVQAGSSRGELDWERLQRDRTVVVRCSLRRLTQLDGVDCSSLSLATPRSWQVGPRTVDQVFEDAGDAAAVELLEKSGCVGLSAGGVRVADTSANAISSTRTASSADVVRLIRAMREKVLDSTGVALTPALSFVDEHGRSFSP